MSYKTTKWPNGTTTYDWAPEEGSYEPEKALKDLAEAFKMIAAIARGL